MHGCERAAGSGAATPPAAPLWALAPVEVVPGTRWCRDNARETVAPWLPSLPPLARDRVVARPTASKGVRRCGKTRGRGAPSSPRNQGPEATATMEGLAYEHHPSVLTQSKLLLTCEVSPYANSI